MGGGWRVVVVVLAACSVDAGDGFPSVPTGADATGADGDDTGSAGTDGDGSGEASSGSSGDSSGSADPSSGGEGTEATSNASTESATTAGTGGEVCLGDALDAELDVPPLCAPTCTAYGFSTDCAGGEICRLKDSATGVCESCSPCGNLHDFCSATVECDILFTCFRGQCTAMCDFTTPQTCGNPAACTDVGHPTHGVCDPAL